MRDILMSDSNSEQKSRQATELQKEIFLSDYKVGSLAWRKDVRNYIPDIATCFNQLTPALQNIVLQMRRTNFIPLTLVG